MKEPLRDDAINIWKAGLDAVRSDELVRRSVSVTPNRLSILDQGWPLDRIDRITVVGAGKAGAGMADGLEQALGSDVLEAKQVDGWVNVPDNCVRPLQRIHLHAARPAGRNEPTEAGMRGAQEILQRVEKLGPRDLCICLISGGGSALLPAPIDGVTLSDKLKITRFLSGAGANIQQLNAVRSCLSAIKGGGLARACRAGVLITLIISDVMGDPLDTIASGPTIIDADQRARYELAAETYRRFDLQQLGLSELIQDAVTKPARNNDDAATTEVINRIMGNNQTAVEAAVREAQQRGYQVECLPSESATTSAEEVGVSLADSLLRNAAPRVPICLVSGGEPIVQLVDAQERGLGGRNQQLVLAGLKRLRAQVVDQQLLSSQILLSAGTDGEDGPTDAAGGFVDRGVVDAMLKQRLDPESFLQRNDAYHFLEQTDGLLKTGPTHTNVCDVRVALVR